MLLQGVPLPARKAQLIDYARAEDDAAVAELEALPEREYRSLDDVGEALVRVQPARPQPQAPVPHEESGDPPGGTDYVDPAAESGAVRPLGPRPVPSSRSR